MALKTLRITDFVPRGNGATVSFNDNSVIEMNYEFDPITRTHVILGDIPVEKRILLSQMMNQEEVTAEVGQVDAKYIDKKPRYASLAFRASGLSTIVPIPMTRIVLITWLDPPLGPQIPALTVFDPGNVASSGSAAAINNNVLTDLCFNDNAPNSAGRELPALGLGVTPDTVGFVRIYWWDANYIAQDFNIETSLDGLTWASQGPFQGGWTGTSQSQLIQISPTLASYIRIRCLTGANPIYCVISEMQAYRPGTTPPAQRIVDLSQRNMSVTKIDEDHTQFNNLDSPPISKDLIVYYLVG